MWNLVADQTREGQVFAQLLTKLDAQRRALGGRVFDVLGDAFPGQALRQLLVEAIRYGDQPAKRAELQAIVASFSNPHLKALLDNILADPEIASRYQLAPAAKGIHHCLRRVVIGRPTRDRTDDGADEER